MLVHAFMTSVKFFVDCQLVKNGLLCALHLIHIDNVLNISN